MNRKQYKTNRQLLRDNGSFALRWMPIEERNIMMRLLAQTTDYLVDRMNMKCDPQLAVWLTANRTLISRVMGRRA